MLILAPRGARMSLLVYPDPNYTPAEVAKAKVAKASRVKKE